MKKQPESQQSHNKVIDLARRKMEGAKDYESGVKCFDPSVKYLDLEAAARYTSLSFWTIREFVISGKLPSVKLPHPYKPGRYLRRILIDRNDLEAFVNGFKTRLP